MLKELYYWLDLNDAKNKPSHSKVMVTLVMGIMMVGELVFGVKQIEADGAHELGSGFLIYTLILAALPWGLNGLKAVLGAKFGGLDTAKNTEEAQKAAVVEAQSKAIIARRNLGSDDLTEPT